MFEIERSFELSDKPTFPPGIAILKREYIKQYYIEDAMPVIRLRRIKDLDTREESFLMTIKEGEGLKRNEINIEVTLRFLSLLLDAAMTISRLKKTRYTVKDEDGQVWEIDVFKSRLSGLVRAEIEMKSEDQEVIIPQWLQEVIVREVTDDPTMSNYALARKAYLQST